jgi:NAD(P)-dependent dehydrogenase (short-subunit alcohol dehydrogenase family)
MPDDATRPSGAVQDGRLAGKRALVTGAARGIGRATALRFAAEGARVAGVDVDQAHGAELAIVADVSDEAAVERAVARAVEAFSGLDLVVANAATQLVGHDARAGELDADVWRRTLDVNLTGVFLTAKHGVNALLASGGGAIVCTGSPAGHYGVAVGLDAYSASKAGVDGLVRVLAADYARDGIRVNGVWPGLTDTPMNDWWLHDAERRAAAEQSVLLGRVGTADEIAAVITFLCSDEASYVTGAVWPVDGGLTAV